MYIPFPTKKYRKSYKKLKRSGKFNEDELNAVIDILASGKTLGPEYQDHKLTGEYSEFRECHIRGDILLMYTIDNNEPLLILVDIGSHSSMLGM